MRKQAAIDRITRHVMDRDELFCMQQQFEVVRLKMALKFGWVQRADAYWGEVGWECVERDLLAATTPANLLRLTYRVYGFYTNPRKEWYRQYGEARGFWKSWSDDIDATLAELIRLAVNWPPKNIIASKVFY